MSVGCFFFFVFVLVKTAHLDCLNRLQLIKFIVLSNSNVTITQESVDSLCNMLSTEYKDVFQLACETLAKC